MKILGVIPSRYGSTRFPGKSLVDIAGKSMVQRVYEQCKKSSKLSEIMVATDDERIHEHVIGFGGKAMMTSLDHGNGTERALEVLDNLKGYDFVVNIQGDEPFIYPEQIDILCEVLLDKNAHLATLAREIESEAEIVSPDIVKVVIANSKRALYFSRSAIPFVRDKQKNEWLKETTFYKHIGIYGYHAQTLREIVSLKPTTLENTEKLEQLRWLENGYDIHVGITPYDSMGIDTPEDLKKAIEILDL